MRIAFTVLVLTAASLVARSASAQEASGFSLGLRSGYAVPRGKISEGLALADAEKGHVPIWGDLGYRASPTSYFGAYFSYGIAQVNKDKSPVCNTADCSSTNLRFGVNAHLHLLPERRVDPWIGFGIGYEVRKASITSGAEWARGTQHGPEVNAQAGGDIRMHPQFSAGPWLSFSLAQYLSQHVETSSRGTVSDDIGETAVHYWVAFGLRGTFDFAAVPIGAASGSQGSAEWP